MKIKCVTAHPLASSLAAPFAFSQAWVHHRAAPNARRRHEFEADAFAAKHASAASLIRALVKLFEDNAATLTPDPYYSAFHDSHPPAALRVARLETA